MFNENIYTLEEVGQHLRVPVEAVQQEIAAGRLRAIDVAGHLRVCESDLSQYKLKARAVIQANSTTPYYKPAKDGHTWQLQVAPDFKHRWPDSTEEEFKNAFEGTAAYNGKTYHVKLGFTVRKAAGKPRARALVLIDRYATVEFVAAEEQMDENTLFASIIKDRTGKQLPAGATVPPEYEGLRVGPYRSVVDGPGAANAMAVICEACGSDTMIKHALIRYTYRAERE